jgi:hypothetical protein
MNLATTILLLAWYISMIIGIKKGQFKRKRSPKSIERKLMREKQAEERAQKIQVSESQTTENFREKYSEKISTRFIGLISILVIFSLIFLVLGSIGLNNVIKASWEIKRITNEINQSGETIELLLELSIYEPMREINTIKVLSYWGLCIIGIIVLLGYVNQLKRGSQNRQTASSS